jgi:SNF2 family DNA or RNA helicase
VTCKSKRSDECSKRAALPLSPPQLKKPSITFGNVWTQLDNYQKQSVEFAIKTKTAALLHEQGSGKTWILGGLVEQLHGPQFQGLVIVPLSNIETTWLDFFHKQLPQAPVYRIWDDFKRSPLPKTLLIHYEGLPRIVQTLRRTFFSLIAYDESQRLKSRSTLASRISAKLKAERRIILSGTPIDKEPQDMWAQFRFLDPNILGKRWKDFEHEYLEWDMSRLNARDRKRVKEFQTYQPGSMRWRRALHMIRILAGKPKFNFNKLPQFLEKIKPYCDRINVDDVLELPPMIIHRVPVALRGDQRRMYDSLERSMFLRQPDITTPMRATQLWKLQQIAGGYVIDDVGSAHEVGRAKLRALQNILRKNDRGPVVVWCKYTEEIDSISDELGTCIRVEKFTGRTPKKTRPNILRDFQSGKIDVLLCQVRTGGVGIDLFHSCVGVMYSYSHSYIDFDQMIKRLRRRGQKNHVDIYLLTAVNTVDEDIVAALMNKSKVTDLVMNGLKRRIVNGVGR